MARKITKSLIQQATQNFFEPPKYYRWIKNWHEWTKFQDTISLVPKVKKSLKVIDIWRQTPNV